MVETHNLIKKDKQIWKFSFYGFLKNLRFFEPFLYLLLGYAGMDLFHIGILLAIREIITYIFEVPSGVFADHFGKKKELMICFIFYMISFVFLFLGVNFIILIVAMIFYGLGDAFRSGTHKAMIYSYLEEKEWFQHKTFVYGRTRSFSLIGSSISSFLAVIIIIYSHNIRWIFLFSIIPYLLDFLLIWSYPNSLDERRETKLNLRKFFVDSYHHFVSIFKRKPLRKILMSSSIYDGIFKTIKDYIQPIIYQISFFTGFILIANLTDDDKKKAILGILYGLFYIFSSMASRHVYRLHRFISSTKLMNVFFDFMAVLAIGLFFAINSHSIILIMIIFFFLYILKDARRPIVVDVCGDTMEKHERATVLSVDSQLKSLFIVILAPLFGLIADQLSIGYLFLMIGIFMLILNRFIHLKKHV